MGRSHQMRAPPVAAYRAASRGRAPPRPRPSAARCRPPSPHPRSREAARRSLLGLPSAGALVASVSEGRRPVVDRWEAEESPPAADCRAAAHPLRASKQTYQCPRRQRLGQPRCRAHAPHCPMVGCATARRCSAAGRPRCRGSERPRPCGPWPSRGASWVAIVRPPAPQSASHPRRPDGAAARATGSATRQPWHLRWPGAVHRRSCCFCQRRLPRCPSYRPTRDAGVGWEAAARAPRAATGARAGTGRRPGRDCQRWRGAPCAPDSPACRGRARRSRAVRARHDCYTRGAHARVRRQPSRALQPAG
jgi:hypothetical protein